jgi:hypothetical protein
MYKRLKPSVQDLNRADAEAIMAGFYPMLHRETSKMFDNLNPNIESLILTSKERQHVLSSFLFEEICTWIKLRAKHLKRFVMRGFYFFSRHVGMLKEALSDPAGPIVEIDLVDNEYLNAEVEAEMKQFLAEIKQVTPQFNIWQQKKRVFNVTNDTISVTDFDYIKKEPSQPIPAYLFFDRGLRDINDLVSLQI